MGTTMTSLGTAKARTISEPGSYSAGALPLEPEMNRVQLVESHGQWQRRDYPRQRQYSVFLYSSATCVLFPSFDFVKAGVMSMITKVNTETFFRLAYASFT